MEQLPLNPVDLLVIVILSISGLIAFFRGFVRELLAVGVWIGAAFATLYGFGPAQPYLRVYIATTLVADAITVISIFVVALVLLTLISNALARRVQESQMGALDRSLGFAFGLVRGVAIASVAYLLAIWLLLPNPPDWLKTAKTTPVLRTAGDFILSLLPAEAAQRSREAVGTAGDQAKEAAERARALQRATAPLSSQSSTDDADSDVDPGYKKDERRALEGLIRGSQEKRP